MPHYANGKPATKGDLVVCGPAQTGSDKTVGILAVIVPGTDTCNGRLIPLARQFGGNGAWYPLQVPNLEYVTLKDCMLAGEEVPVPA